MKVDQWISIAVGHGPVNRRWLRRTMWLATQQQRANRLEDEVRQRYSAEKMADLQAAMAGLRELLVQVSAAKSEHAS